MTLADGCTRPARYGNLCTACFLAATSARRAVELAAGERPAGEPEAVDERVDPDGAAWLRVLWAA